MDGYVTIGTKLDTKQLEKDLNRAQRELLKLDNEAERLQEKKIFIELDLKDYYKSIEEVKKNTDRDLFLYGETDEQAQQILEMEEQTLANIDNQYAKQLQKLSLINAKIKENADAQENIKGQVSSINAELEKVSEKTDIKGLSGNINKIGTSIGSIIGKVAKWGLALLGVRTVLSVLTRSFSTLSQYNDDLASKMEGIKLLLAVSLEPVINWLISALQVVMQIIGTIYKTLFGIDIYARANELSAKKMAKSFGSASKSAKDMRKQLAGFDEMNVLADNVKASGGGGAGGTIPDIGELKEIEKVKEVAEWVKKNWPKIKATVMGGLWEITETLGPKGLLSTLGGLPTAVALNWGKVKTMISNASQWSAQTLFDIAGKVQIKLFDVVSTIQLKIYEVCVKIGNKIVDTWNNIKSFVSNIPTYISNIASSIGSIFSRLWETIKYGAYNSWEGIKSAFSNIVGFFSNIISKIVGFFKEIGTKVGDAIGGAFKNVINSVLKAVESILNTPIKAINKLIDKVQGLPGTKNLKKLSTFSLPRLAKGGIINQPGRGVMVGNAIAGERGAEGVIPLTDAQQMALLGQAIGKYISVNITNPIYMNGRQIAKEINTINQQSDFAFNR